MALDGLQAGSIFKTQGGGEQRVAVGAGSAISLLDDVHNGRTILLDTAAGSTVTLPAVSANNIGCRFRFIVSTTATSNSHIIKVANSSDIIQGVIMGMSDDPATVKGFEAGASDDTITFNRSTTGTAKVGHWVELEAIKANTWAVRGSIAQSGTEATPFSATV